MADPTAPVFAGWNVWAVWQVKDLPFDLLMVGVSRDSQLRIWVEDHVRTEAPGVDVADPVDLKGSKVEILPADPGLRAAKRKEDLPGSGALLLPTQDQPPELRFVRFFNRGSASQLLWPHDDSYLLDAVYAPDPNNPVTRGPAPPRILESSGISAGLDKLEGFAVLALLLLLAYGFSKHSR